MKGRLAVLIGSVAAIGLIAAPSAGAATQVGSTCVGNTLLPGLTIVSLANGPGNPFPATIPSAGVATRWTFNHALTELPPGVLTQALKILRPTGVPKQFQVVGESSGVVTGTSNTFPARIPVQPGDHLASVGRLTEEPANVASIFCAGENLGDLAGVIPGDPPPGATVATTEEGAGAQIPVVATIEPDADQDGFGDETQDACPQSPTTQVACPTVVVEASRVIKRKNKVIVLVTTDVAASARVTGVVNLGKKKKAKLGSKTQTVVPGNVTRFTLNFPKKLKNKLRGLARKRSLQLRITASATDSIGRVTKDILKTKLKGQKKRKPRRGSK